MPVRVKLVKKSVLAHGSEAWTLTPSTRCTINGFNSRFLHRITKRSYGYKLPAPDHQVLVWIQGTDILNRFLHWITKRSYGYKATEPTFNLVKALRQRRLRWLGHIMRIPEDRLLRRGVSKREQI